MITIVVRQFTIPLDAHRLNRTRITGRLNDVAGYDHRDFSPWVGIFNSGI
jgi:hypothetical protein